MALLVPQIGEVESLRYLLGMNNHVLDLEDTSPRNLILKLFVSNTTPGDLDAPCREHYYEPYNASGTNQALISTPVVSTGYATCVAVRTEARYEVNSNYGILLNGSRWTIEKNVSGATTASYPEQTFTFSSAAGDVYGYFLARGQNMPQNVQYVPGVGVGTYSTGLGNFLTKGTDSNPTIGIVGNRYFTIDGGVNIDDITVGMAVTHLALPGNQIGITTGTRVVGIDRVTQRVYVDNALEANIQVATGSTVRFDFTTIATYDRASGLTTAHQLQPGDVIFIGNENGTGITTGTYTVFSVGTLDGNTATFQTTPAMTGTTSTPQNGVGTCTLYPSIFYAERFTNGPYSIANNGDQIKVTLNVELQ